MTASVWVARPRVPGQYEAFGGTRFSWIIVLDARSDSIDIDSALISTAYLIPPLAVKPKPLPGSVVLGDPCNRRSAVNKCRRLCSIGVARGGGVNAPASEIAGHLPAVINLQVSISIVSIIISV